MFDIVWWLSLVACVVLLVAAWTLFRRKEGLFGDKMSLFDLGEFRDLSPEVRDTYSAFLYAIVGEVSKKLNTAHQSMTNQQKVDWSRYVLIKNGIPLAKKIEALPNAEVLDVMNGKKHVRHLVNKVLGRPTAPKKTP